MQWLSSPFLGVSSGEALTMGGHYSGQKSFPTSLSC
jgi:hypothetical protein